MKTAVVVPMKSLANSKTRLAPFMSHERRAHLSLTLFDRALTFFGAHFPSAQRVVVTSSAEISDHARSTGAMVLSEQPPTGLNAAAGTALNWALANAFDRLIIVPADIPVWLLQEVTTLLQSADRHDVAVARAADGGTNALVLNLKKVRSFAFCYGAQSAREHEVGCVLAGLRCEVLNLPFLGHDIDTVADCLVLSQSMQRELQVDGAQPCV